MPVTQFNARREIYDLLKAVTDTIADLGTASERVIWDDTRKQIPDGQDPVLTWARAQVRHVTAEQAGLVDASSGVRRYTNRGIVTVQLFTAGGRDGLTTADPIVSSIKGAFQGVSTPNGVWFRNVRTNEIGNDGSWFQTNILADFEYDEQV